MCSRNPACPLKQEKIMHSVALKLANWFSIESEAGVTAIEYGLLASLVAVVIVGGATLLGTNLNLIFNFIAGKVAVPA
jgi:pilus assembly protein Flp/PilA